MIGILKALIQIKPRFVCKKNVSQNSKLNKQISITHQTDRSHILKESLIKMSIFISIYAILLFKSEKKLKSFNAQMENLKRNNDLKNLNFGGSANELWCNGGELLF